VGIFRLWRFLLSSAGGAVWCLAGMELVCREPVYRSTFSELETCYTTIVLLICCCRHFDPFGLL
jgi:hypothetical protein